jgi:hypothetical protein
LHFCAINGLLQILLQENGATAGAYHNQFRFEARLNLFECQRQTIDTLRKVAPSHQTGGSMNKVRHALQHGMNWQGVIVAQRRMIDGMHIFQAIGNAPYTVVGGSLIHPVSQSHRFASALRFKMSFYSALFAF